MRVDLHNHTKYSDGNASVLELLDYAKDNNVDLFAITDHDVVTAHLNEAKNYSNIIAGIELSCYYNDESVHIVGLFKNNEIGSGIYEYSSNLLNMRKERAVKMLNNLQEIYQVKINLDELLEEANGRSITRGNMARHLRKHNPNLSLDEIRFLVSSKSKAYIPASKMSPKEGIELLHRNNAVAILAHPVLLKRDTFNEIIDLGFDGLECYYPRNSAEDTKFFLEIAKNKGLLASAGSDCHNDLSHSMIGTCTLDQDSFSPLAQKLGYDIKEKKWK